MNKKAIAKLIGERITNSRKRMGIDQKELARILNIGQTRLSNWEIGETPAPVEFLPDLSRELGVSTDYLLGLSVDSNGDMMLDYEREELLNRIKSADKEEIDKISKMIDIVIPKPHEKKDTQATAQ